MKFLLYIILFSPFLVSCQEKYNHQPYDEKEKDIRMMPISQNEIILDSIWDKRDSLSYIRLVNTKKILLRNSEKIPNWLYLFPNIENLIVDFNSSKKIQAIPNSLGNILTLKQITFSSNNIRMIPEDFYKLKSLTYLNLDENKISGLSKKIKNLQNLKSLHLSNNPLLEIPEEICALKKLESLVLENTQIKKLPACLANLPNLDWVNVSGTQLTKFPVEILNAPKLETIHARGLILENYQEVKAICEQKNITIYYDE